MRVADNVGIPFHVLCAFLEQESYGGKNVFGHDPTIFVGAGRVTKRKYLRYKAERDLYERKRMQGVGPMQLTWWTFQDEADILGGCWKPYINMTVGAKILKDYWKAYKNWEVVGTKYNGSVQYGYQIGDKIDKWEQILY